MLLAAISKKSLAAGGKTHFTEGKLMFLLDPLVKFGNPAPSTPGWRLKHSPGVLL
jgi:hypothetical protein